MPSLEPLRRAFHTNTILCAVMAITVGCAFETFAESTESGSAEAVLVRNPNVVQVAGTPRVPRGTVQNLVECGFRLDGTFDFGNGHSHSVSAFLLDSYESHDCSCVPFVNETGLPRTKGRVAIWDGDRIVIAETLDRADPDPCVVASCEARYACRPVNSYPVL